MNDKIAIYLRDLLGGGVEKRMLILAEELVKRNYKVDLLTEKTCGELSCMIPEGVTTVLLSEPEPCPDKKANAEKEKTDFTFNSLIVSPIVNAWYTLLWVIGLEFLYRSLRNMLIDYIKYKYDFKTARLYFFYLTKLPYGRNSPEVTTKLTDYLIEEQPRVVITGLEDQNFRLIMAEQLAKSKAKCIISVRNHLSSFFPLYYTDPWHKNYRTAIQRLYPKADKIVAVSKGIKDDLIQEFGIGSDQIEVIYNPVVNDEITKQCSEPAADDDWLNDDVPVLLSIGRLHKQKGFDVLLKALSRITKKMPARLIILGEGADEKKLKETARKLNVEHRVRFSGFQENPFPYMAKSSVYVLSSLNEGLPGALIEAMACGCPVVSTDCKSGPGEILEDGKFGEMVPVNRPHLLAEAIISTLNKDRDPEQLKKRAAFFHVEKAADQYIKLFDALSRKS